MKKEMIIKDEKYEIEYTVTKKETYLQIVVKVNDIDIFDFEVSNYKFDSRLIVVNPTKSNGRNRNIANAVFDDYFLSARNT